MNLRTALFGALAMVSGLVWAAIPPAETPTVPPQSQKKFEPIPKPDWVTRQPFARTKRWFRWQDVRDKRTAEMLAEAADEIAAFRLQIYGADLEPPPGHPTTLTPETRARLRVPPVNERPGSRDRRWTGSPYGFTAIGRSRLAYLAFMRDVPGGREEGYIEGFVFEKQPDGKWMFVCHLSGFPQWRDDPKGLFEEPMGTRVPPDAKPEC